MTETGDSISGRRGFLFSFFFSVLSVSFVVHARYSLVTPKDPILLELTKDYKDKKLDLHDLDELVQEVAKKEFFQKVSIEILSENEVALRVKKIKKMLELHLVGNRIFSKDEILKKTKIGGVQTPTDIEILQAVRKITEMYQEAGFYNAKVTREKKSNDEGYELTLRIDEGKSCTIKDISVFSRNKKLNKKIKLKFSELIGTPYKKSVYDFFQKEVKKTLIDDRYLVSKISNSSVFFNGDKTSAKINLTITNPIQFEFIFYGNKFFSYFNLIDESQIGDRVFYIAGVGAEVRESLRKLYIQSGFSKVEVQYYEMFFSKLNKKTLVFKINEGPRMRINRVRVFGNISKKESYYKDLFFNTLNKKHNSVYFVRQHIQSVAQDMITQLKRSGYFEAKLITLTTDIEKEDRVIVNLEIDEGSPTYIRQVLFPGAKSFSRDELREQLNLTTNEPIKVSDVEDSFEKLIKFYKNRAFLEFKIKNEDSTVIDYKANRPYVDLIYQIEEGPRIRVADIKIKGNKKTKPYVLLREINFKKGEFLTLDKVTRSIENLERTGLFGKINIHFIEPEKIKNDRNIVVDVQERKPGVFSSGIGLLSQGRLTYRGYAGVLYNNLWGTARGISGRADLRYQEGVKYLENRLMLSYYEPFIFKNRVRARVSLVREQELFDFRENNSDILSTNEVQFILEKEFSSHFRLTHRFWRFSNQEIFNVNDQTPRRSINIGSLGPVFEFDYRNDPFLPTKGNYTRLQMEYADPFLGSDRSVKSEFDLNSQKALSMDYEINYYKASFSTTQYLPLTKSRKWIWSNSFHGGYLKNVSSAPRSGVPRVRSFFLGGSSTIRGFTIGTTETVPGKRELCLKKNIIDSSQSTDQCRFDDVFVSDDSSFFLVKSELRFPFIGPFGCLVFYDGGAVYLGEFKLQDPYRDSVGFGFHYDTPVGSFVIQMGYKLDSKSGGIDTNYDRESRMAVHLAIGNL